MGVYIAIIATVMLWCMDSANFFNSLLKEYGYFDFDNILAFEVYFVINIRVCLLVCCHNCYNSANDAVALG